MILFLNSFTYPSRCGWCPGSSSSNGMAEIVPGSRFGQKHNRIRTVFRSERAKL